MILNDEYMKEFRHDMNVSGIFIEHMKCGEKSDLVELNLLLSNQWAEKHRYTCPEIEVDHITVGGFEDGRFVMVTLTKDGRTRVEVRKNLESGLEVEQEISRKLVWNGDEK
jgi:hypothetical protein